MRPDLAALKYSKSPRNWHLSTRGLLSERLHDDLWSCSTKKTSMEYYYRGKPGEGGSPARLGLPATGSPGGRRVTREDVFVRNNTAAFAWMRCRCVAAGLRKNNSRPQKPSKARPPGRPNVDVASRRQNATKESFCVTVRPWAQLRCLIGFNNTLLTLTFGLVTTAYGRDVL